MIVDTMLISIAVAIGFSCSRYNDVYDASADLAKVRVA